MSTKIVAEVAGKVWKIEAQPGARLAADQVILILESMKMEIPVAAPHACTLLELRVREGEMVEEGRVLAIAE
jgi:acetyl-CoA carboxylase biotin carboxyl carrier protein